MSFQKQMLSQYNDLHRDKFNQELLERSDDKIIEKLYKLILSCQREQPRLVFKVKSFRVIENYSEIQRILHDYEESTIKVPFIGKVNLKNVSLMTSAVIIGLIDGFNPCAMWVLLFLISVLIGMKDKKRMWALGGTFLFVSAFIYMLIMLSWISMAVKMTTVIWIRNLIAILALIGAFVNIKSFFNYIFKKLSCF